MNLNSQYPAVELSRKLNDLLATSQWKNLTFHQYWILLESSGGKHFLQNTASGYLYVTEQIPAFSVAELGVMLPKTITFFQTQKASICYAMHNGWSIYYQRHSSNTIILMEEDTIEANARAKMLIRLLEDNRITSAQVNEALISL